MKFTNDQYNKDRGNYSRLYRISCEKCEAEVCHYQKDGPGNLRRMYLDRIINPKVSIKNKQLLCPKDHVLGIKIIYKKENRPAYRLFVDAIIKNPVAAKDY